MVFRKDDSVLMKREYSNFELIETNLDAFITLVDEYVETTNRKVSVEVRYRRILYVIKD
jgi:hypothetical protein